MKMKIRPLGDRVVVLRLESENKTATGIVIPDSAKEKPNKGKVLFVGPGKTLDNGDRCAVGVKVGDVILFGKYAGTEFKLDDQDVLIMREEDIMGVIEG